MIDSLSFARRGWRALGRLPPVLRALPGAARAHGPPRHPAGPTAAGGSATGSRSTSVGAPALRTRLNPGLLCTMSTSTRAPSAATPPHEEAATRVASVRIDRRGARPLEPAGDGRRPTLGARGTEWADYADHTSYGDRGAAAKERHGQRAPGADRGQTGLGPGREHRALQPDRGRPRAPVLAFDIDPAAVERNYRQLRDEHREPTSCRWSWTSRTRARRRLGERRAGLSHRARQRGCALALALIHHLAISRNVPLPMLVDLFARLARVGDRRVRAQGRPDGAAPPCDPRGRLPGLHARGVPEAAASRFVIVAERPIDESPRVLLLLRRR